MSDPFGMPSTMWTVVGQARGGDRGALDTLLRKYRTPVLAFLRRSCGAEDEAEDLTQEVFLTLLRDDVLSAVDPAKGRFRRLLMALARHALSTKRRREMRIRHGGDRKRLREGAGNSAGEAFRLEEHLAAPEDDSFDSLWVRNLVWMGMERLREECESAGTPHYRALVLHTHEGLEYSAIAERLGATPNDVRNYLHQARVKLKRYILAEVRAYSSSGEYEAETARLARFLE